MKEFYLDSHSTICKVQPEKYFQWCDQRPERILLFLDNRFFIVSYHSCLAHDKYDFIKTIIESAITNNKIYEKYEVNRGVSVSDDLKEWRLRNTPLRKYVQQVNYLYSDNAGKSYAITTKVKYIDAICDQEAIRKNFIDAELFIQNKYPWMKKQLEELYVANLLSDDYEVSHIKAIDHLIDSINQLTK